MTQRIEQVVQALNHGGISAIRSYPEGNQPELGGICAAVGLHHGDSTCVQVSVTVYVPVKLGGAVCEDTAIAAGSILRGLGAKWEQGGCTYHSRSQMLSTQGYATFSLIEKVAVTFNGVPLSHLEGVTVWRETDKEVTDLANAAWRFRLEEVFPASGEEVTADTPFTMVIYRGSNRETCTGCVFTAEKRQSDGYGVRTVREGTMQGHTIA